ncbi:MAG: SDR family oxidoreductase [Herminiimonas sp.]|nr:SDR family oxidoreductase [Herminiimonas sp.]MDO9419780.1 SDR family oxidoreductase [Herminiimonas sp.]
MTFRVLVTGANGFVGQAVIKRLKQETHIDVRQALRLINSSGNDLVAVGDIHSATDWTNALGGVDVVVHCAARVHVMNETAEQPLALFRSVNVEGTKNLAIQAANAGVKRFVFVSSVKVNGEKTTTPFNHMSTPAPADPYGISKAEAEAELWKIAKKTGMEGVIVRPPLVYGPMVKANFQRLMRIVEKQIPLPFGAVNNRRSMIFVDNLADLIFQCVVHPAAPSQTFLASDGSDLSTPELIRQLASAMGRKPRLLNVPTNWMTAVAALLGKAEFADRLLGSLEVDISRTCQILDWHPPFSVEVGMKTTVNSANSCCQ